MRELAVFSRQFATLVASGMPMLRTLHTLEEQTQDEKIKEAVAGRARRRRGRQHPRAGDGAPPRGLRPPLPGDGPLRRGIGPTRGRARPDRLPGGESRRAAAPGQIGADVPGAGLRLRGGGAGRDRRLRHPGLRRHLRRTRRRKPGGKRGAADADPDLRHRLGRDHRLLVHHASRRWSRSHRRLLPMEEDRSRQGDVGPVQTADPVQDRRRDPEGRAGPLVAHLLRLGLGRRADAAGDQTDRRNGRQRRHRAGDGGRLRLGQARRLAGRRRSSATRSSRRWSATWSRSARKPVSSSTC